MLSHLRSPTCTRLRSSHLSHPWRYWLTIHYLLQQYVSSWLDIICHTIHEYSISYWAVNTYFSSALYANEENCILERPFACHHWWASSRAQNIYKGSGGTGSSYFQTGSLPWSWRADYENTWIPTGKLGEVWEFSTFPEVSTLSTGFIWICTPHPAIQEHERASSGIPRCTWK